MHIKLYQINPDRDTNRLIFCSLDEILKIAGGYVPDDIYDCVFEGDINARTLDEVFELLNADNRPNRHTARAMTMSDIIEIITAEGESHFFFCDRTDFVPLLSVRITVKGRKENE